MQITININGSAVELKPEQVVPTEQKKLGCGAFVGLSRVRAKAGFTQGELAQALDKSQALISKIESGRGEPSNEVIFKMAELFGKSVDELMTEIFEGTAQIKSVEVKKDPPKFREDMNIFAAIDSLIDDYIEEALRQVGEGRGQRTRAAKLLGFDSYQKFAYWIKRRKKRAVGG